MGSTALLRFSSTNKGTIKKINVCPGDNGSDWVQHWVKGGHKYFYNLQTKEGTWVQPEDFVQNNTQLNKEDIQVRVSSVTSPQVHGFLKPHLKLFFFYQGVVSGVTTAYNREQLWLANETLITKLQARCRGYLVRKGLKERMSFLKSQDPAVTCIQVSWGGFISPL